MNNTINISLPKGLAKLAEEQVKAGYYSSISEVIRDALRKMLMEPAIPTFKMSEKAEKILAQAIEDHKYGKTTLLNSLDDLDNL